MMSKSGQAFLEEQIAMGGERAHREAEFLDSDYLHEQYVKEQAYIAAERGCKEQKRCVKCYKNKEGKS